MVYIVSKKKLPKRQMGFFRTKSELNAFAKKYKKRHPNKIFYVAEVSKVPKNPTRRKRRR